MLGYTIHKTYDNKRYGSKYQHLYINIFLLEVDNYGEKWQQIGKFSWQTDNDREDSYWYAHRFNATLSREYLEYFEAFLKFGQKLAKSGVYGDNPQNVVNWLIGLRGMVRITFDHRISEYVSFEEAQKTADQNGYKIVRKTDGRLLDYAIGFSENDAISNYLKKRANDYSLAKNVQCGIEAQYNEVRTNDLGTIEDILEIVW